MKKDPVVGSLIASGIRQAIRIACGDSKLKQSEEDRILHSTVEDCGLIAVHRVHRFLKTFDLDTMQYYVMYDDEQIRPKWFSEVMEKAPKKIDTVMRSLYNHVSELYDRRRHV